jgi:hypothetical protein
MAGPAVVETVPAAWDDERDTTFFRIVVGLFSPAVTLGATVLLASYDAVELNPAVPPIKLTRATLGSFRATRPPVAH